ncbi:GNAT superfamily N-acetyltransferase [Streptomyces umbrinus]|uniref:GNAT superfamily N-acetyltransferase n=1 Tax=Streptomyces umbrinus TaxID=67370 RepID=A0ABU0SWK7_9ACTN|nr:hypothetical protein [Streptomyces umbrinus]MDQ1027933.1 GNAT superfamily N-acetyltransferase [Streptomyces umbrinus]
MTEVYLRRLSRWQAEQQRAAVADVYVTAYRGAAGAEYRDRQGFLDRFEQHVQRLGFDMTVADAGGLVGCAYGFRVERTGEWWSDFRGELPTDIEELTASGRTFLLAELMVLPAHRRHGVATLLGERLLARLEADLVVAAVDLERPDIDGDDGGEGGDGGSRPANAAQETVRAWGWSKLGVLAPHSPSAVREVWIRRPLR